MTRDTQQSEVSIQAHLDTGMERDWSAQGGCLCVCARARARPLKLKIVFSREMQTE